VRASYRFRKGEGPSREEGSLGLVIVEWYNRDEVRLPHLLTPLTAEQLFVSAGACALM